MLLTFSKTQTHVKSLLSLWGARLHSFGWNSSEYATSWSNLGQTTRINSLFTQSSRNVSVLSDMTSKIWADFAKD